VQGDGKKLVEKTIPKNTVGDWVRRIREQYNKGFATEVPRMAHWGKNRVSNGENRFMKQSSKAFPEKKHDVSPHTWGGDGTCWVAP